MLCEWTGLQKGDRCRRCRYQLKQDFGKPPRRECTKPGLGSRIRRGLAAIGITRQRYLRVKKKLGLSATCGCEAREAWLNQLDAWDAVAWTLAGGSLFSAMWLRL